MDVPHSRRKSGTRMMDDVENRATNRFTLTQFLNKILNCVQEEVERGHDGGRKERWDTTRLRGRMESWSSTPWWETLTRLALYVRNVSLVYSSNLLCICVENGRFAWSWSTWEILFREGDNREAKRVG